MRIQPSMAAENVAPLPKLGLNLRENSTCFFGNNTYFFSTKKHIDIHSNIIYDIFLTNI